MDVIGYKTRRNRVRGGQSLLSYAQVAQLVEHVTENHGVGGSIPSLGTSLSKAPCEFHIPGAF